MWSFHTRTPAAWPRCLKISSSQTGIVGVNKNKSQTEDFLQNHNPIHSLTPPRNSYLDPRPTRTRSDHSVKFEVPHRSQSETNSLFNPSMQYCSCSGSSHRGFFFKWELRSLVLGLDHFFFTGVDGWPECTFGLTPGSIIFIVKYKKTG